MDENEDLNLIESKYARLELIPWWNQELLFNSTVMVVGAGAIGNEIIKNLALLGVGKIIIVDIDKIENTNLTRSILYREKDIGKYKADVAAKVAMEINPDIKAISINKSIISDIGLGLFRNVDIVLAGLDNREARLAINKACYKVNKIWIDGAIEALNGVARVFAPPGPCYECTMTEMDWKLLNKRKSCALLSYEEMIEGKIPTTSTSSSVIAGIEVQEMLKILHKDRNLPTLAGKGFVFNGLTHDSYVVEYQLKDDCMSHDLYENIILQDWSSRTATIREVLFQAKKDLGMEAILEFDREIITEATCSCGNKKEIYNAIDKVKKTDLICEKCEKLMKFNSIHTVNGSEKFLDKYLYNIGIPLYHIISARKGLKYCHYQLEKDKKEVLGGLL